MAPTKDRNHQSMFIEIGTEGILLDCGEGTQRQLKIAKINPNKITKILLTHLHGDHVLGLPGLLETLSSYGHEKKIEIYGPVGTKKFINDCCNTFNFKIKFETEIKDISKETIKSKNCVIKTLPLKHGVPCIGYSIKENDRRKIKMKLLREKNVPEGEHLQKLQLGEDIIYNNEKFSCAKYTYIIKGKKMAIILDTLPCKNAYSLAKDSELLICESSYDHTYEKKAKEFFHMTARQAAQLASEANVKKLIITHFSQRYKTPYKLVNEAKMVFDNVEAAYDFMKVKLD